MAALSVRRIAPADAAQVLQGMENLDPRGIAEPGAVHGMTERGACFLLSDGKGSELVYVLNIGNRRCWVNAAAGTGALDLTTHGLAAIEFQAAQNGLAGVAFQTLRPGLVRKARKLGYQVRGWVLGKELNP